MELERYFQKMSNIFDIFLGLTKGFIDPCPLCCTTVHDPLSVDLVLCKKVTLNIHCGT
jgi:hypothetical protein